ncbi:MAG: sulfotransferase domain-containing protein [Planctomycetota bacterium]
MTLSAPRPDNRFPQPAAATSPTTGPGSGSGSGSGTGSRSSSRSSSEVSIGFRERPLVVLSHPRSGTHLMIDGLRHFFRETKLRQKFNQPVHDLYINLDRLDDDHPYAASPEIFQRKFEQSPQRIIVKSHCGVEIDQVGLPYRDFASCVFSHADLVYVVRDVRPVLASYMALRPLKFPDSPTDLQTFLRTELDADMPPAAGWANHIRGWLERDPRSKFMIRLDSASGTASAVPLAETEWAASDGSDPAELPNSTSPEGAAVNTPSDAVSAPRLVIVRFEDMMKNYAGVVAAAGRAIGLTPTGEEIRIFPKPRSIRENKIRRIFGRQHSSSIDNLRMKMKTPDWKSSMTADDFALIRSEAGDVMHRLGYSI